MKYTVLIYKDEDGQFVAQAPDIPECAARRETLDELYELIPDVAELCLEDKELPPSNSQEYYSDAILNELSIPLSCSRHILNVTEEDEDKSYEVELIL